MPPEPLPIYTLPSLLSTWILSLCEAEAELAHQTELRRTSVTTMQFRLGVLRYTLAQFLHWLSTYYRLLGADLTCMCMQWNRIQSSFAAPSLQAFAWSPTGSLMKPSEPRLNPHSTNCYFS